MPQATITTQLTALTCALGGEKERPPRASPACRANHHIPPKMRSLSPALASLANVFRIPTSLTPVRPTIGRMCQETLSRRPTPSGSIAAAVQQSAPFSSTSALAKRKGKGNSTDKRISMSIQPQCSIRAVTRISSFQSVARINV